MLLLPEGQTAEVWEPSKMQRFFFFRSGEALDRTVLSFLGGRGGFAKLREATISFVMSVRMEHLGSRWVDFHEI